MAPDDDPKVKTLLGPETEADLARWFSLPSYQQLADQPAGIGQPAVDAEMQAVIDRRTKALSAVDLGLVEAIHARTDDNPRQLIRLAATIDVRIDQDFGMVDSSLVAKALSLAEPRELERPDDLEDALKECTEQALLRDLHRPELDVAMQFEIVDMAADQRLDVVAEIASVMATRWKLPAVERPFDEGRSLLGSVRAECRKPLTNLASLPNRRVHE